MEHVVNAFKQQGFMRLLNASLEKVEPGLCEISISNQAELRTHHGLVHGGVIASIADASSGFAAFSLMDPEQQPLTVEFKINFLSKSAGQKVVARANVLKHGRTLTVCKCDVFDCNRETETLCATALVSIMAVDARSV